MKILRILIIILLITAVAVAGYWYLAIRDTTSVTAALTGSGTVETTQVTISPELTGRVVEVSANQGQSVKAGDILFKLDDGLLAAQRNQAQVNLEAAQAGLDGANTALVAAQAAVATAQAQYDLALASARQQAQPARSLAWSQIAPSEFDQPIWYFTHAEEITAAQDAVSTAGDALTAAATSLSSLMSGGPYTDLVAIEARLALAQATFLDATDVLNRAQTQDDQSLQDAAQESYDDSEAELEAAQQAYDELLSTQETQDILDARARLAVAQEHHDTAVDRYNALLTGEDSLAVKVAANSVAQAQANVAATESKVVQAQKAIDQAQAASRLD